MNEHFGKVVKSQLAGVELELIIVEFPVETKPKTVRCIDRKGTRYSVAQNNAKGTGEMVSSEEITKIAARAVCRRPYRAASVAR